MTTLYVDNIAPNLQSKISAPNLTLPSGSILQVQQSVVTLQIESSASTGVVVDLGFLTSITPSATSSKIMVNLANYSVLTRDTATIAKLFLQRRINNGSWSNICGIANYAGQGGTYETYPNVMHMDSPNTTSQVDYRLTGQRFAGSNSVAFHHDNNDTPDLISTLTAMEIAG